MDLSPNLPCFAHRLTVRLRGMLPVCTDDVSEEGFCADMLQPLKAGTSVQGFIAMGDEELPFQGEIVWTQQAAGERVRGHYGVRFTHITEEFRRRLHVYRKMQGKRLVRWFT